MVFARLPAHEKEAFFSLLDEYFEARPELLSGAGGGSGIDTGAAASAVSRAYALSSNPSIAAPRAMPFAAAASNQQLASSIGKVAAASRNFSNASGESARPPPPPVLPRRASSTSINSAMVGSAPLERTSPSPSAGTPGAEVDKLFTRKSSLFGKNKTPAVAVHIPPAFAQARSSFAPPPMRRDTSNASADASPSPAAVPSLPRRAPSVQHSEPEPEPEPEPQEEEAQGEWAEALYDYDSADAGDLQIREGQNIWVTEKSSGDWWTGQIDGQGKEGLFPASYVKLM